MPEKTFSGISYLMNRGGGSNGGAGGGTGGTNPTPPSAYGHYQPYMSPYSSQGLSPGGPYQTPVGVVPVGPHSGGPPEQFGNNFNVQGGGYYNHPSPNEDQPGGPTFYGGGPPGHPPGSAGSPGSRDLSYYGFNNGFGNGGDGGGGGGGGPGGNGGSAFYQQQQHQTQQDNNNKVSNLPGDTASVHEFGDTIKKEQHEQAADLKQEQPQDQSSVTSEATSGGPGGPTPAGPKSEPGNGNDGPQNSDMNNSDNQTSRSQQSTPQDNRNISPKTNIMNNPGLKRSPASHESSEFEQQFEQSMAAAAAMPHGGGGAGGPAGTDEYMRQMAMGNQSTEGKLTVSSFFISPS